MGLGGLCFLVCMWWWEPSLEVTCVLCNLVSPKLLPTTRAGRHLDWALFPGMTRTGDGGNGTREDSKSERKSAGGEVPASAPSALQCRALPGTGSPSRLSPGRRKADFPSCTPCLLCTVLFSIFGKIPG